MALPDGDGFLFHHTFGKTLRGKDTNTFMVKKCHDPFFCPVANLRLYFVKLAYSLTSNFPKATRVIDEADVFDREGSGWGYEEFFPLCWAEFKDQLKRTPLIITSQVSLLE